MHCADVVRSGLASPLQERLLFLEELDPERHVYTTGAAFAVSGVLDEARARGALARVVGRHEALRTSFAQGPDSMQQRVHATGAVACSLESLAPGGLDAVRAFLRRRFDTGAAPLIRAALGSLDGVPVLAFCLHHAIADASAIDILVRDFLTAYDILASDPDFQFPAAGAYLDWVQAVSVDDPKRHSESLAYWEGLLRGANPAIDAFAALHGTQEPSGQRDAHVTEVAFAPTPTSTLRAALGARRVTLFHALLAAASWAIAEEFGQRDVCLLYPASLRREEDSDVVGMFVNTVIHRARLAPGTTFCSHLENTRNQALDSGEHDGVDFGTVSRLVGRPSLGALNAFPLVVTLDHQESRPNPVARGLELVPLDVWTGVAKVDVLLACTSGPRGLTLTLAHDPHRTDAGAAGRFLRAVSERLRSLGAAPTP